MEILSAFIEELRGRRLTEMDRLENLSNRAEASEATCQSLREQSSRWEAQALEAGVRIAELEAQVEAAREVLEVADLRGDTDLPYPANDPKLWSARMRDAWDALRAALQPAEPQEGKE
jgi:hypothetical protein